MARDTSRKALQGLKDSKVLSRRQVEAIEAVRLHGPGTGREIEFRAIKSGFIGSGMWKRFSELKAMNLVHETQQRKCTITNRAAYVLRIGPDPAKVCKGQQLEMFPTLVAGAYQ
jgi:hypothetical protein